MLLQILALWWGCMPELHKDCIDMTTASGTYLSVAVGAIVGAVISWWIFHMQNKTSVKQDETLRHLNGLEENHDETLRHINGLEENHDKILKSIQQFEEHQDKLLSQILNLDKKIDSIIEKEERE
jgi:uncharacterized membrane-anchored protein YhcB (DUF1043 family)